jgi:hypothetical protein
LDSDEQTFWHNRWSGENVPNLPHFMVIDYRRQIKMAGIRYVARSDQNKGHVKEYEIYTSNDGEAWGQPAKKGHIGRDADDEIIEFTNPVQARYIKFVMLSQHKDQPFASVAESEVLRVAEQRAHEQAIACPSDDQTAPRLLRLVTLDLDGLYSRHRSTPAHALFNCSARAKHQPSKQRGLAETALMNEDIHLPGC